MKFFNLFLITVLTSMGFRSSFSMENEEQLRILQAKIKATKEQAKKLEARQNYANKYANKEDTKKFEDNRSTISSSDIGNIMDYAYFEKNKEELMRKQAEKASGANKKSTPSSGWFGGLTNWWYGSEKEEKK